jgi:SAM-dependent methyltransferase
MTSVNAPIEHLFKLAIDNNIYPRKQSLDYHFKDVFEEIELDGKNVLDIGGGIGLLSFFSALNGAKKIVCLEPESDGSCSGMITKFNEFKSKLNIDLPVQHLPLTLQEYLKNPETKFDIVVLHNSINHLNEEACIHLEEDKNAYNAYVDMFRILFNNMSNGSKLIISDCSRYNFYNSLGMKSPFINSIEWHKHQHPKTWIRLLEEVGFSNSVVNWSSPNRLGDVGRKVLKNAVCAYFTSSHFRLAMDK